MSFWDVGVTRLTCMQAVEMMYSIKTRQMLDSMVLLATGDSGCPDFFACVPEGSGYKEQSYIQAALFFRVLWSLYLA